MRNALLSIFAVAGLLCGFAPVYASTVYVRKAATGAGDGSSWTNAFTDL